MKDFIIVGFGLAGMAVARELETRGRSFVIFEEGGKNASRVAGGITNPLILKRFTKAWKADAFIPVATQTYQALERELGITAFHSLPIYRRIKSVREQNDWFVAADKPDLAPFMEAKLQQLEGIEGPFNFGKVLQTSFLDTELLLDSYRHKLQESGNFKTEKLDYSLLKLEKDHVSYLGITTKNIVFCEGYGLLKNPYFKGLPLIGNKGEYLRVKIPDLKLNPILKTALALIPLGHDNYKFGATYSRDFQDGAPEDESRVFLIQKLEEITDLPYEILGVEVGVRPTVRDRRPLLGSHHQHKNLLVCNGFGSHGVMMAPTLAKWLLDYALEGHKLPKKVDITRYYNKGIR